jgi:hypothetical protein
MAAPAPEEHECRGKKPRSSALHEFWHLTGAVGVFHAMGFEIVNIRDGP